MSKKQNIVYVHNMRFPTEKAHGYQIAKMCEAFAELGNEVELVVPQRKNEINQTANLYYGVKNFKIKKLKIIDALSWPLPRSFAFFVNSFSFLIRCVFFKIPKFTIIYTRTPELAWLFKKRGFQTIFECHQLPTRMRHTYSHLIENTNLIITISKGLKKELENFFKIKTKIEVSPDGVDLGVFDLNISKHEARAALGIDSKRKIVVYTGQLIKWKGVDLLAETSEILSSSIEVYFIGGSEKDVTEFKSRHPTACFHNIFNQPRTIVSLWQKAADLLILPNTGKEAISARHTSPLKLFEYMASGTPIVASDLPSIREILDETMAIFYKPDDPKELARAIEIGLSENALSEKISLKAKKASLTYTWKSRAEQILSFLKPSLNF